MAETSRLLAPRSAARHRFGLLGVPHDAATTLGFPGARFAPEAVRTMLRDLFGMRLDAGRIADADRGVIDLSAAEIVDFGDVELSYAETLATVEQTAAAARTVLDAGCVPIVIGGDHGITFPIVKALHDATSGALGLVQLDAHNDLDAGSVRQGSFSGSSGMRRALELERVQGPNLVQIGLRGYTTVEQHEVGERLGVRRISARRLEEIGAARAAEQALRWATDETEAVYLTIDMDVLDPGAAPGTGLPEPAGITTRQLLDIVRVLAPRVSALDVAELNPLFDTRMRATAFVAARIVLDFITARVVAER
jgi:formiminoglutamase/agmatinase